MTETQTDNWRVVTYFQQAGNWIPGHAEDLPTEEAAHHVAQTRCRPRVKGVQFREGSVVERNGEEVAWYGGVPKMKRPA